MRVYLYPDPASDVNWEELVAFLRRVGAPWLVPTLRSDVFAALDARKLDWVARRMAEIRVLGLHDQRLNPEPYPLEVDYECRNLRRGADRKFGPIYSGFPFQALLRKLLPQSEHSLQFLHVVFTNQRLATWETQRWHLRTILLGVPVVISTVGLVEAPAREREYYLLSSVDAALAEKWLAGRRDYLEYNDPRMTEILKGYLWQALFFHISLLEGRDFAFCENERCALYNSHWQRELFTAQMGGPLCEAHRREWERVRRAQMSRHPSGDHEP